MVRKYQLIIISLFGLIFFAMEAFTDDRLNTPLSIRVGSYENKPKIYTDESGRIVGLFPDILNHISKKEGSCKPTNEGLDWPITPKSRASTEGALKKGIKDMLENNNKLIIKKEAKTGRP